MIVHFLFAFICSVIFSMILTFFLKRHAPGPFGGILYFFAIIFLSTMALGLWLTPMGPMYRNVPWLSVIAIGLLVMLLIAELLPHKEKGGIVMKKNAKTKEEEEDEDEEILEKEFGIIGWVFAIILIAAIIYAIVSQPDKFKMTF